jgi:hypothetical protein
MHRIVNAYLKPLAFMTVGVIASACVIVNDDDDKSPSGTGGSYTQIGGTSSNRGGSAGRGSGGTAGSAPQAGTSGSGVAGASEGGAAQAGASGSSAAGTSNGGAAQAGTSNGGAAQAGTSGSSAAGAPQAGASSGGVSQAGSSGAGEAGAPSAGASNAGEGGAAQAGAPGGGAGGAVATSNIARIEGASFFEGSAPAAQGGLAAPTVAAPASIINGGTARYLVTLSGTNLQSLLIAIEGDNGYYVVPLSGGATEQAVSITLLPAFTGSTLAVGFAIRDAAGNVTAWSRNSINVVTTGTGDVKVSLTFDQDEDLDLYVTDPLGNKIMYSNRDVLYVGGTVGGHLDLDSNAACMIDGVNNENIFWDPGSAPRGSYLVEVDYYKVCAAASVNYTVTVSIGSAVSTYAGSFVAADVDTTRNVATFTY